MSHVADIRVGKPVSVRDSVNACGKGNISQRGVILHHPDITYVFVSMDVFKHAPLLVEAVVSSLSVGLKLLDGGGGGPVRADPVHRGRHSLAEPGLDGPYFTVDLEQYRLHALIDGGLDGSVSGVARCLQLGAGFRRAAVSHRGRRREKRLEKRHRRRRVDRWEQLRGMPQNRGAGEKLAPHVQQPAEHQKNSRNPIESELRAESNHSKLRGGDVAPESCANMSFRHFQQ